jgi:predicted 3-demethylubiquinone-9 3-methyltransferase (glyoxalase superfamily)
MTSKPFTTCLWFDDQGEDAARFYTSVFKNSHITGIHRYTDAGPGPEGSVFTVEFELNGQKFFALNGGPEHYGFSEAVSIMVECEDQAEVDYYWDRLTEGGAEVACGWLTDKYGFRWQIVPARLFEMMRDPDQARVARLTSTMMTMVKLDIAALERAYAEG